MPDSARLGRQLEHKAARSAVTQQRSVVNQGVEEPARLRHTNAQNRARHPVARDNRDDPGFEGIAPLADWIAGIIAGQFPADRALAGRVLMAAAQ